MTELPRTVWMLIGTPDWPNEIQVRLAVDTVALPVVEAIENAAARAGLVIRRVEEVES